MIAKEISTFNVLLGKKVDEANVLFERKLKKYLSGGLKKEQYIRYLQMQYHLTKGVQQSFMSVAASPEVRSYKKLRQFLVRFAWEEEMHFKLAEKDLKNLGAETGEMPFLVQLWWAYQKEAIAQRPLERLGAASILENVGNYAAPLIKDLFANADFINNQNTTFTRVHMHEELPHGDQIMEVLGNEDFTALHQRQILEGAEKATWLYADQIYNWIITGKLTSSLCSWKCE